jgi:hypothetical protein
MVLKLSCDKGAENGEIEVSPEGLSLRQYWKTLGVPSGAKEG